MSTAKTTVTVELQYPIENEGKTLKTIAMRRPTVGDSVAVQQGASGAAEGELRLVSLLSGLSIETIAKLDMKDYVQVQSVMREMMG
ncbi:MAG: phage tail assembly protein [bacterium]